MKMKLGNFFKIAFVLCGVLLFASSCTKEYYTDEVYVDNPIEISLNPQTILKEDWKWNEEQRRYVCVIDFPELTKHMYDDGVISASVFLKDGSVETQSPLPFIQTWKDGDNVFTETLSYDISFEDKSIAYYIQSSDLGRDDYYLPDYEIKVSVVYYKQIN